MDTGAKIAIVVALVGVGVLVVHAAVISPSRQRKAAQREVEAWAERWQDARRCIVRTVRSPDLEESLALHELLEPDAVEKLASCRSHMGDLERPPGDNTGVAEIEDAWLAIDKHVPALASALAWRVSTETYKPPSVLRANLAKAVADMDERYARLRQAVRLPPDPPPEAEGPRLPGPEGGVRVPTGGQHAVVQGGAIVAHGIVEQGRTITVVRGPGAPEVWRYPDTVTPAFGAGWGVWVESTVGEYVLRASPLDERGQPVGAGGVVARVKAGEEDLAPHDRVEVIAAAGSGAHRAVVYLVLGYGVEDEAWLVRSRDGGATWPDRRRLATGVDVARYEAEALGRVELLWTDLAGALFWLSLADDTVGGRLEPVPMPLGADEGMPQACHASRHVWWLSRGLARLAVDDKGRAAAPDGTFRLSDRFLACDDERALVTRHERQAVSVLSCDAARCQAVGRLPYTERSQVAGAAGARGAALLVLTDEYVLVARDGGEPRPLWRVPLGVGLGGLVEWDGAFHAVLREQDGLRVVPLP